MEKFSGQKCHVDGQDIVKTSNVPYPHCSTAALNPISLLYNMAPLFTLLVGLLLSTNSLGFTPPIGPRPSLVRRVRDAEGDGSNTSSKPTRFPPAPTKKPWTFGMLTSGFPPQQLLVPFVKFVTFQVWRLMMNELVTHDNHGRFIRESFQAGNDPSPLELPSGVHGGVGERYRLYM
eukprot:scaffold13315_cov205-Alexandrium_tamarense.AAC.16